MRLSGGLAWLAATAAGLAGAAVLRAWMPPDDPDLSICFFRHVTHLPCPGCGLTRAFSHLARREYLAAFLTHPLSPLVALEAVAAWLVSGIVIGRRLRWRPSIGAINALLIVNASLLVGVWLVRLLLAARAGT